jgi:hypothetical protein
MERDGMLCRMSVTDLNALLRGLSPTLHRDLRRLLPSRRRRGDRRGAATYAIDPIERWGFAAFIVLLVLAYVSSLLKAPPSVDALWMVALGGALVVAVLAWWVDRQRAPSRIVNSPR